MWKLILDYVEISIEYRSKSGHGVNDDDLGPPMMPDCFVDTSRLSRIASGESTP